jgi:hypothetical protein
MKLDRLKDKLGDIADALVGWRPDAFMVAGAGAVAYGAWMIYPAAGFIVGGILTLVAGWLDANRSAQ